MESQPTHPPTSPQAGAVVAHAVSVHAPRTPLSPLGSRGRVVQLDFLRGIALFGILVVNMSFFFEPFGRNMEMSWLADETQSEQASWSLVHGLFAFKFISLFSLMFGYGAAMQFHRVDQAGRSGVGFGVRRFGFLILLGMCHGLLVWYGDILFIYGCLGLLLIVLRKVEARVLLWIAAALAAMLVCIALMSSAGGLLAAAFEESEQAEVSVDETPPGESLPDELPPDEIPPDEMPPEDVATEDVEHPRGWEAMTQSGFDPTHETLQMGETLAYREGPLEDALLYRSLTYLMGLLFAPLGYGLHAFTMMLLGMWAFKTNFWAPENARLRKRVACIGLGAGLPLSLIGIVLLWVMGFNSSVAMSIQQFGLMTSAIIVPAGYAVVIGGAALALPGFIVSLVSAAGRMALSTYLLESLIATTLSYWWGFALYGSLSGWQQLGLAVTIWCSLIVFARVWMSFVGIGPMEWVWRVCTYRTLPDNPITLRSDQPAE